MCSMERLRANSPESARGALLDSTLDRYVEWFVVWDRDWDIGSWMVLVVLDLFGSMMVTYSTAK